LKFLAFSYIISGIGLASFFPSNKNSLCFVNREQSDYNLSGKHQGMLSAFELIEACSSSELKHLLLPQTRD